MSKKKKTAPVEKIRLSGRNIYTDKKGRVIFYDMITKKGYLVDKKNENSAVFFKNRFVVILFAAILFGATFLSGLQAVIAWAVMMALAEFAVPHVLLEETGACYETWILRDEFPRCSILSRIRRKGESSLLAVLYFLFAVLVVLNAYMEKYSTGLWVFSGCLAVVGIYFGVLHIIALTKMKNSKKKWSNENLCPAD